MSNETIIINLDIDDDCNGGLPQQLPSVEQVFEMWNTNFDVLLKFSDNFDASKLAIFENDPILYVKTIQ
jgi:hypothetical protein